MLGSLQCIISGTVAIVGEGSRESEIWGYHAPGHRFSKYDSVASTNPSAISYSLDSSILAIH